MKNIAPGVENWRLYLCTLLAYKKGKTAGVTRTFAQHSGELQAACGSYARAFKFLCGAAGIPCFTISTSNHTWNMVYVDGQWLHVDVSANDLYHRPYILLICKRKYMAHQIKCRRRVYEHEEKHLLYGGGPFPPQDG